MLDILTAILPIFLLIMLGHLLKRNGIPSLEFWNVNDKLVYWVLFPALLFFKMSTSDIVIGQAGPFIFAVVGGFFLTTLLVFLVARVARFENPVITSVMQGSSRHNTFIGLAVAESLYGIEGVALAALATSVLVPPTNVIMVTSMTVLHPQSGGKNLAASLAKELVRNPLILSVSLGLAWNLTMDGAQIPILHDTLEILGSAALPIVLLAIGAHLAFDGLKASVPPFLLAIFGKFLLFPVFAIGLGLAVGLDDLSLTIVALYASVPTASNAFTLSRQMGGDADLMASIITLQTLICLVTLPLVLGFLPMIQGFFP